MNLKEHYKQRLEQRMLDEDATIGRSAWQPTTGGPKLPSPLRTPGRTYVGTGGMFGKEGFGTQKVTFPMNPAGSSPTQAPATSTIKPTKPGSRFLTKILTGFRKATRAQTGL